MSLSVWIFVMNVFLIYRVYLYFEKAKGKTSHQFYLFVYKMCTVYAQKDTEVLEGQELDLQVKINFQSLSLTSDQHIVFHIPYLRHIL